MEIRERIELFKEELNLIVRKDVRDFTKAVLEAAPDYVFWDCPSSSSGKYHPIDELDGSGTVLHTRKVFAVAYELSRGLDCEKNRDLVLAAVLLHDMTKQGLEKGSGHTVRDHPQIAAKLIADVYNNKFKDKLDKYSANMIYHCVFHHYGLWGDVSVRKSLSEYTSEELCVYLSDYIASKRFIKVDYLRRDGLGFVTIDKK
jgi:23S rRNA maturation-related 3'-5' exoribonuclease YhaM